MLIKKCFTISQKHKCCAVYFNAFLLADDNIFMLETDIQLYGAGTQLENSSLPVMAHDPPALDYELTLKEWMDEVSKQND